MKSENHLDNKKEENPFADMGFFKFWIVSHFIPGLYFSVYCGCLRHDWFCKDWVKLLSFKALV